MTIDLVIFDCDGVLIDSEPASSRVLCRALNDAGVEITEADVHRRFTGHAAGAARRICTEELGVEDVESVFGAFEAALFAEFSRSLTPMPGIGEVIASLKHRKCVASNSTLERLHNSLGLFDLWHAFAPHVFSADMVARPKPAPDLFFLSAETLDVDPARCLVVDDSPHGIAGAVAAGMKAIGFVDPADPREGRHAVLSDAGAVMTATGAAGLARAFETILGASALRTHHAAPARPTFA
ncbi:HAD family hydrolase [Rhizobiaceae bacterium BDR2-2]|uniref:HAD family hydrolase n=1 Tax=Ectorhizobium quercum TaxID=2965071 RepID=A0AAE3N1J0_9HYPH|nr:HAD family hydrolase [Ectorhizobium quercum]MCX8998236.1 HAD family hydrolase [Ectorhizobium quercum]